MPTTKANLDSLINDFRSIVLRDSISPESLGSLLQQLADFAGDGVDGVSRLESSLQSLKTQADGQAIEDIGVTTSATGMSIVVRTRLGEFTAVIPLVSEKAAGLITQAQLTELQEKSDVVVLDVTTSDNGFSYSSSVSHRQGQELYRSLFKTRDSGQLATAPSAFFLRINSTHVVPCCSIRWEQGEENQFHLYFRVGESHSLPLLRPGTIQLSVSALGDNSASFSMGACYSRVYAFNGGSYGSAPLEAASSDGILSLVAGDNLSFSEKKEPGDSQRRGLGIDVDSQAISKELFIKRWNLFCGSYGKYDPDGAPDPSRPFYLNELWLTFEEALRVDKDSAGTGFLQRPAGFCGAKARTLFPLNSLAGGNAPDTCNYIFLNCINLEVICIADSHNTFKGRGVFDGCKALRKFIGGYNVLDSSITYPFPNSNLLEEIQLRVGHSVSFANNPKLSLASFTYMVNNATNKDTVITITVHPDVYAKLTDDHSNPAVQQLSGEELAKWIQLLSDAMAKNITFATA